MMNNFFKPIALIIFLFTTLQTIVSQVNLNKENPTSSYSFGYENKNRLSDQKIDSIYNNNAICKKFNEVVKLDTFEWAKYPKVELEAIPLLKKMSANELAQEALNVRASSYYNNKPFNLVGSYSEAKAKIDTSNLNKVYMEEAQTNVSVYDEGFNKDILPKAHTDQCSKAYQHENMPNSVADIMKLGLGGKYSNLYNMLDLDFLRMYDVKFNPDMGVDRRKWTKNTRSKFSNSDNFRYHCAFKKDSSVYIVLQSQSNFSIAEGMKNDKNFKIQGDTSALFDDSRIFKYLVINLSNKTIENSGYFAIHKNKVHTYNSESYETSYKLIDNHYYVDKIRKREFLFLPRINHIEMNENIFQVDSVISDPKKVKKISNSKADPRKENYIDYLINKKFNTKNTKLD